MLTFERMRYLNNKVVHDTQCNIIAAQSSSEYLMLPKQKHVIRAAVLSKITQIYYEYTAPKPINKFRIVNKSLTNVRLYYR